MDSLSDDLNDLLSGDDDDLSGDDGKKKRKKGESAPIVKVLKVIGIALSIIMVISGGLILLGKNQQKEPPPPAPDTSPLSLQLVNLEQVDWADRICVEVGGWQTKVKKMPEYTNPASGPKVRDDMSVNLLQNADIVKQRAQALAALPQRSHDEAASKAAASLISDNNATVGADIDPIVRRSTQMLTSSLNGYAASLTDMSKDLKSAATYDAEGIRAAIRRVSTTFNDMNAEFTHEVEGAINDKTFDNVVTMQKVSELDSCNGSFIDSDELNKERGPEIEEQKAIRDFVTVTRCKQFVSNASLVKRPSSALSDNVNACNDVLSTVTVDTSNPLLSRPIDSRDGERAQPNMQDLGMGSEPSSTTPSGRSGSPTATTTTG